MRPTVQPFKNERGVWEWMNIGNWHAEIIFGDAWFVANVPDGFRTNLASIPKLAQWLFFMNPYEPAIVEAALVHDWLSPTKSETNAPFGDRPMFPPYISAGVFYELMKEAEVPMLRRQVYYHAVVLAVDGKLL